MKKGMQLILSIVICIAMAFNVGAAEPRSSTFTNKSPRGRYISTAVATISDNADGTIGIVAATLTHENVDKIIMRVYLEVWDDEQQDWKTVRSYDFIDESKDHPEGLSSAVYGFDEEGLPVDKYYRLRGMHSIRKDRVNESLETLTDGILITDIM